MRFARGERSRSHEALSQCGVRKHNKTAEKPNLGAVPSFRIRRAAEFIGVPFVYFGPRYASLQIAGDPSDYSKSLFLRHVPVRNE
jgi:hypothetical protein